MRKPENLDEILTEGVQAGATDIHFSVGSAPRMRIAGSLEEMKYDIVTPAILDNILFRNTKLTDLYGRTDVNTTGQFDMSYQLHNTARFRVNIFRQKGDLAAVFRVLPESIPDARTLGIPMSVFNLYNERRGMILIVGPTGSGKSTTLASFIDIINQNERKHIITLEDPIEYVHWHSRSLINQREIGVDCDTFANGLRAALREDPDVILVGEMRDLETTDVAITAAETGHLVCSTLHTLGAGDTIDRVISMYPFERAEEVKSMLSGVLKAVVSQQLMPRVDGKGRVVAFEVMFVDDKIKEMIRNGEHYKIRDYIETPEAKRRGMISMDETIAKLYQKGSITKDTALEYAFNRTKMETLLRGTQL